MERKINFNGTHVQIKDPVVCPELWNHSMAHMEFSLFSFVSFFFIISPVLVNNSFSQPIMNTFIF